MDDVQKKNIGQKLRELRIRRGLTQQQLAGKTVTRNMLSLTENGRSVPSLATLTELSSRLGVQVGYFFATDEREAAAYLKMSEIDEIRDLLASGNTAECRKKCESLPFPDDEIVLILAECALSSAEADCRDNHLQSAAAELKKIEPLSQKSVYVGDALTETAEYLMLMIRSVAEDSIPLPLCTPEDFPHARIAPERFLYFTALSMIFNGDSITGSAILDSRLIVSPFMQDHLEGALAEATGETEEANAAYQRALTGEADFFTSYKILGALARLAEQSNDYKNAYAYAAQKTALLEQFGK